MVVQIEMTFICLVTLQQIGFIVAIYLVQLRSPVPWSNLASIKSVLNYKAFSLLHGE